MAKRELSSNLKNLKFMQRALQKQGKTRSEEETTMNNKFASSSAIYGKCMVIMEGNPHPGALKGRMSFQSFNPSIDKLNEEAANVHLAQSYASSNAQDKSASDSPNESLQREDSRISRASNFSDVEHKRKQPEIEIETHTPYRTGTSVSEEGDGHSSSESRKGSYQQRKREKLDWSVLRPPKPQTKRG